ncbi:MAG: hydroxylase [Bacteroidota bacterium]
MTIHYLEIVTPEVDAVCATYARAHDVTFGEGDPSLGGARTAELAGGGMIGVRPPLRANEEPVVRPYMQVADLRAAVGAASESGAEVAISSMELGERGTCAIVLHGGVEIGFWEV